MYKSPLGPKKRRRCYFYPRGRETPNGEFRIESHTDKGFITLLWQDRVGGLQALVDNEWISIPFKENCFVVNLGDMMEYVTYGVVKGKIFFLNIVFYGKTFFNVLYFLQD